MHKVHDVARTGAGAQALVRRATPAHAVGGAPATSKREIDGHNTYEMKIM